MSDTKRTPKWVIMVYLAADDTLANFAIESLKQLKATATEDVVVAAQFDPDGLSNEHQVRRYVFNESTRNKPLLDDNQFWKNTDHRSLNMTDPQTLSDFMNWVYEDYPAENYCIVFWGHGPEMLFELPLRSDRQTVPAGARALMPAQPQNGAPDAASTENRKTLGDYFTPAQLKEAFGQTNPREKKKLQIIAMDACSMSMCEYAHELQNEAKFLVASQEEVPDLSFSYDTLVELFTKSTDPRKLCQEGVGGYVKAYQEYFYNESTGMHPVTLAAVDLKKLGGLSDQLKKLSQALLSTPLGSADSQAIFLARAAAQDYVGGLYVDLHDFCDQLGGLSPRLKNSCDAVSDAIDTAVAARAGVVDGQVMEFIDEVKTVADGSESLGRSSKLLSHGLSIYFPYLKDDQTKEYIQQDLVKGIPRLIDKDSEMQAGLNELNSLSARIRYAVRQRMIQDIEDHYLDPPAQFGKDTGWYQFIQKGWSCILASQEPDKLDTRYLAHQCAKNLLDVIQNGAGGTGPAVSKKQPSPALQTDSRRKSKVQGASSGR